MAEPIAVYVHIPFCTIKCGYCDFNAYAGMHALAGAYREAMLAEIAGYAEVVAGRETGSVGFGGGTPSEVPASDIAAVLDALRAVAPFAPGAEVTLEANPGTVTAAHLRDLRAAGVNRLSLGAQSFDAAELRFLDRIHSPEATAAAAGLARQAGFESVNLDLIYGLPGQTMARWEANLAAAIALAPDHVSCYCLTIEEGTPLAMRIARGTVEAPDADLGADMYERAEQVLAASGFEHYELSNWARPGHNSRHNLVYWTGGEYLGIGAGAHGFVRSERYENVAHPKAYIAAARGEGHPVASRYVPAPRLAMADFVTLGLRLVAGFEETTFTHRFGVAVDDAFGPELAECVALELVERAGGVMRLTSHARQLHSEVAVRLLSAVDAPSARGVCSA